MAKPVTIPNANSKQQQKEEVEEWREQGWAAMPVPSDSTFFFSNILFSAY